MKNAMTVTYLVIAGLVLLAIGLAVLVAPHGFHGSNGISLGDNPNLLSEIRAPGGLLAGCGIFILLGALRQRLRLQAMQLSTLVYGSYGVARLISLASDGMPSSSIVGATLIELIIALIGISMLWLSRNHTSYVDDAVAPPRPVQFVWKNSPRGRSTRS